MKKKSSIHYDEFTICHLNQNNYFLCEDSFKSNNIDIRNNEDMKEMRSKLLYEKQLQQNEEK